MARERSIVIRFGPHGEREIEAFGFQGKVCKQASKFIEDALGTATDVRQKAEWFMRNGDVARETKRRTGVDVTKHCG